MSWLGSEGLSTLVGLALVLGVLYQMTDGRVRNILMVGSLAFFAMPVDQSTDFSLRVLILALVQLAALLVLSLYYHLDGRWATWCVNAFIVSFAAVSLWIWIQRDAPSKAWVIPLAVLVAGGWLYMVIVTPGLDEGEYLNAEIGEPTPTGTLLKRDMNFLQSMYDATNGRPGIYIQPWQVMEEVHLTEDEARIAADRLLRNGSIEWDDEVGLSLKRKGVDSIERHHRAKKKRGFVSNTFNFHGNASGVFGSHNTVRGNAFYSNGVPVELVEAVLSAAAELRDQVDIRSARELELAEEEVRQGAGDESILLRATRRMAGIATSVGEVGAPLFRAANEVLNTVTGS